MRYHILRFDVWLCLLISFLIALGVGQVANQILSQVYEGYLADHQGVADEIGGPAGAEIFRAESVDDLLSHDTFTIVSHGIQYRNRGAGYYQNFYLYAVELPSGEIVAARVNDDSVTNESGSIFSGESILPVGHIVMSDLTSEPNFLQQIEHSRPLTRTDFYIDMVGETGVLARENFVDAPSLLIELLVVFILFPIFHAIGSKLGLFPYFFTPKQQKASKKTKATPSEPTKDIPTNEDIKF